MKMSTDELLKCPKCGSTEVTTAHEQMFMANTGEHYCHRIKTHDAESRATCLGCEWIGRRDQLTPNVELSVSEGKLK